MKVNKLKCNQLLIGRTGDLAGSGTAALTTGIYFGSLVTAIALTGNTTNHIAITGAATDACIDIANTITAGTYGIYMKNTVTGFAGGEFQGAYIRAEAATNAATTKSLYGLHVMGVSNAVTHTSGSLWGTFSEAYIKGDAAQTINHIYAGQFELTMDAGRANALTITTAAACVRAKMTLGNITGDTKVHGYVLTVGDMDGAATTIGTGLLMQADSGMGSTCLLTTGISITIPSTTAISITGACTTALLVPDDSYISWGASADVKASWTGQELLFEDTRTIDVDDGYNRTIHVGNTVTMTASRYAALSNYTTAVGTGGLDAYGLKSAMVQGAQGAITGHFGAGMFEVKNYSGGTDCCTASAIFLRWDNDCATGFGGDQSFIRVEDNSSQTKVRYFLDTLSASTAEDADTAMIRTGGNAATNIQNKQGMQVKINGSAYYIPLIAVGDWQND